MKKPFMKYVFFKVDWSGQFTLHEDGMDPLDMLSLVKMLITKKIGGLDIDAVIEMLKKHRASISPDHPGDDKPASPCQHSSDCKKPSSPSGGPPSFLDFPGCMN